MYLSFNKSILKLLKDKKFQKPDVQTKKRLQREQKSHLQELIFVTD